jgi:hypothetical protein
LSFEVAEKVRARSLLAESSRLFERMRVAFEAIARRYNDDFFNSVLVQYTRDMGMSATAEFQDLAPNITAPPPHKGDSSESCRTDINAVLSQAVLSLTKTLGYSKGEAVDILTAALAHYLDERFTVSSRRLLGWATERTSFWAEIGRLAPTLPDAKPLGWTARPEDLAIALRAAGFHTTAVTVERELLDNSERDSDFPWKVTLVRDGRLRFEPK